MDNLGNTRTYLPTKWPLAMTYCAAVDIHKRYEKQGDLDEIRKNLLKAAAPRESQHAPAPSLRSRLEDFLGLGSKSKALAVAK